ncbi:hypothetical protein NBRC116583_12120 [Arenicella sp. 4NH20-0111]|uniref:helix-turn-helix transcriptional regulator n=1 Tax=Arenicella sp. 4NH20-0111 TaxID=3127648 RepID=UPI00310A0502
MNQKKDIEQILVGIALLVLVCAGIFDLIEDRAEGATAFELSLDFIVSVFVGGTLLYIWKKKPAATKTRNKYLERKIRMSNQDLIVWKSRASKLLLGLGLEIDQQFDSWVLTKAEKEVALLLIKGISLKELAYLRSTNEKTVRQQASSIYSKANLESRAELSAFFLEDLLLP